MIKADTGTAFVKSYGPAGVFKHTIIMILFITNV